ncbi:hypothetical protein RB597_001848 [Gaeumannomyces tritici]
MATSIDPNAWYAISETRVDNGTKPLDNTLQTIAGGGMRVWSGQNMWQFQPVDGEKDRYLLRSSSTGVQQQLAACYNTDEIHPMRTRACMTRTTSDDSQKWSITRWSRSDGINSWKIQNVGNGTGYALDVHPGDAVFLNSDIEGETINGQKVGARVAQHWVFSSRKAVDDGAFSTIYSNTPVPAATETRSSSSSSSGTTRSTSTSTSGSPNNAPASPTDPASRSGSSTQQESTGLSSGAAAGIGVGATIGALALIGILAFFFWRRRKAARRGDIGTESYYKPGSSAGGTLQQQQQQQPYPEQGQYQQAELYAKSGSPFTPPYGQQQPSPQSSAGATAFEAPTPYTTHMHEAPAHMGEMHEMQGSMVARELGVDSRPSRVETAGNEKFARGRGA